MSAHPDHAAFVAAVRETANELAFGMHPEYDQSNGNCCVVGIAKRKLGIEAESGMLVDAMAKDPDGIPPIYGIFGGSPLHTMYGAAPYHIAKDQYEGSVRAFKYLETV